MPGPSINNFFTSLLYSSSFQTYSSNYTSSVYADFFMLDNGRRHLGRLTVVLYTFHHDFIRFYTMNHQVGKRPLSRIGFWESNMEKNSY
jgi:hypothetical protein